MREIAFDALANAYAEIGDFDAALLMAERIDSESSMGHALAAVAIEQAKTDDFEGALQTAESIRDKGVKVTAYTEIAKVRAEASDSEVPYEAFQSALRTAKDMEEGYWKTQALANIAIAQMTSGDLESGRQTVSAIDNEDEQDLTMLRIAEALAESGIVSVALEIAQLIKSDVR